MLRCASSFVVAAYDTVRLTPQDRERKPEAPLAGRRGARKNRAFFLAETRSPEGGESIACLASGAFYEAAGDMMPHRVPVDARIVSRKRSRFRDPSGESGSDDTLDHDWLLVSDLVTRMMNGQPSADPGPRRGAINFLFGGAKAKSPEPDIKAMHAKIGQLSLENDFLESALTKAGLLSARR